MQNLVRSNSQVKSQGKPVDSGRGTLFPGGSDWMQFDPTIRPSPFDFDVPDWMFPPIPCPVLSKEKNPHPIRDKKVFLVKRAFHLEEWLAAQGYQRHTRIGYLDLTFDVKAATVSRVGHPFLVRLGEKLAGLFTALFHAGPTGLEDYMLADVYPGTLEARRRAKTELRHKLACLGVTIAKGGWTLEETCGWEK